MAYLKRFHQRADCTLTPSQEVVDKLLGEGFHNVYLLGRGVDTDLYAPAKRCEVIRAKWGASPGASVAVMVGRVAAEKNFDLAMVAFERMRQAVPDVRCVVVGDGPLRENLAEKYNWVHFAGVQQGEDLAKHYASADVLLFPSETETFGNVLLESMASGLVTVSYDYAAAALHVRSGENGLKAKKGDAEGFLKHAVDALSYRPNHPLRVAAREVAETLGWDQVVREFESRLESIAGTKPSSVPLTYKLAKRPTYACKTVFLSDIHLGTVDSVSTNHQWIASLGAVGYDFLLKVNRFYNLYRSWRGKEYFSLSKRVKAKVKSAVSFVDRYEELLQDLACHKKCDGIICGHIHTPEDKQVGEVHYLNSGDWVESLTAIIEHNDGRMELVQYETFLKSLSHTATSTEGERADADTVLAR